MTTYPEQRRFPRMSTSGRPYRVSFRLMGQVIEDSRLANLSACGCGLEVQMAEVGNLELGSVLEALYLDHPELPLVPLQASVVRILGKVPGKTQGYALVGLEFLQITDLVRDLIQEHVVASMEEATL